MKRNDLTGIGDILGELSRTTKLGETLKKAELWNRWPQIVGEESARHCRPRTVQDGQLRIEVESAVWMHRLAYRKYEIIKQVNRYAGRELAHDIFLVLIPDGESIDDET